MITIESDPEVSARLREVLFEVRGVSEFFPGVRALEGVDFTLHARGVHALIGENSAGKSTLMEILSRLYRPGEGEALVWGEPITLSTPFVAQQVGISVIHQEFSPMNCLTMAQNMFVDREPRLPSGLLDYKKLNNDTAELLERFGVKIDPYIQVGKLTVAFQQLLGTTKALSSNSKVLIMDEPTAVLSDTEVEMLFWIMDGFIGSDAGIVYIFHCIEGICRESTQITVLRDGKFVDSRPSSKVTTPEIIQLTVGHKLAFDMRPEPRKSIETILNVRELSIAKLPKDVSFHLERGEILGFAGSMGTDHAEVTWALIGANPRIDSVITVDGKQTDIYSSKDAVKIGTDYLSEGRKRYGLVLQQDVTINTVLPLLKGSSTGGLLQDGRMRKAAGKRVKTFATKIPSMRQQTRDLFDDNQQKAVLVKWLEHDCDILVLDESARGIDAGARQEIYGLFDELTDQGKLIIAISSEMEEVLHIPDRIAAMCNGRITGFFPSAEVTQGKIVGLATRFTTIETTSEAN